MHVVKLLFLSLAAIIIANTKASCHQRLRGGVCSELDLVAGLQRSKSLTITAPTRAALQWPVPPTDLIS